MAKKKNKQSINDIFFGKAGEVFTNARLFLRFKKAVKIVKEESKAVEDARAKIAKLYGKGSSTSTMEIELPKQAAKEEAMKKVEKRDLGNRGDEGKKGDEKKEPASPADISPAGEMVFIPLSEIAKKSAYSKNYINFSARQGKLKAEKIKGIWHTTEQWLAEFTEKSLAKKNKTKEKLSHDLGGNKKFAEVAKEAEKGSSTSPMEVELPQQLPKQVAKEEEIGSFPMLKAELEREMIEKKKAREELKKNLKEALAPRAVILRARKSLAKNWNSAKTWVRELGVMEGSIEASKLRRAKLADFWKLDFAKPAAAMIALVLLMAIGNITRADIADWADMGKKNVYKTYNNSISGIAEAVRKVDAGAADQIAKVKIGKEKFVKIASDILRREKIKEFEKNSGLALRGNQEDKGNLAALEQGGAVLAASVSPSETSASQGRNGVVLAAATGAAQTNVGDIEVSAYLMDGENKELTNGEYDVRLGIYTTDRTEADPYPSDADQGTRVWEETQKVVVENGLLKTYLGAVTPIPSSFNFASSNYYIGIRVGEDAEMTPRKRIGAVPLARTAMSVEGQTIGNGAGNIPLSNGTLNTNLNADLLDGQHSSAFQVAGSYQPAGAYDNYLSWKLASSLTDPGMQIKTKKAAIFAGGNGILTSRLLNTLTISLDPAYSPTFTDITATTINATTFDLGTNTITDENFTGDWNFNAGDLTNINSLTAVTGNFTTTNITTIDLGTNTITDQNFTGDWNFNGGDLTNINSLTAVTGNFTTTNITTGNITTANITNIDLGTNTITDQNFTGDWNFNGGDLLELGDLLPAANLTYNLGSPALRWNNLYVGTANLTTIDLGVNTITDAQMTGDWNFSAGNLTNITALTATTINATTFDLGTNTITDAQMTGDWNFSAGNLTNITALTATTGNFTTLDLGTNTIYDQNLTGNWNFNAGTLTNISAATVTGNFNLTASSNLIFGNTTSLGETTAPTDSGAYMVGANDEFANSASTNVQGVLKDLDIAIASGGPGAMWTLTDGNIYPTNLANNVGIGTSTPGTAKLSVMSGNVGIGTTAPGAKLDIGSGDILINSSGKLLFNKHELFGIGDNEDLFVSSRTANTVGRLVIMPNGTVTNKMGSEIFLLRTDFESDPSNYEALVFQAGSTCYDSYDYFIAPYATGTGVTLRNIWIGANADQDNTQHRKVFGAISPASGEPYGQFDQRVGILTTARPTAIFEINGGTLSDQVQGFKLSATLPATPTADTPGVYLNIASAGSANYSVEGLRLLLNAGYTGSYTTRGGLFVSYVAGTQNTFAATFNGIGGNFGFTGATDSTTTGNNIAGYGQARGGNRSIGLIGLATTDKNSATNIGVAGFGRNTGTSPVQIGGYFSLENGTPTFESAALVADNSNQTSPIFLARDNGSTVFTIKDGGNVGIGTTSPGSTLQVNGNAVIGYSANTSTTGSLAISGNVGIGTTSPGSKLEVYTNTDGTAGITSRTSNSANFIANMTASGLFGQFQGQRNGAIKYYLGMDSTDDFAILNSIAGVVLNVDTSGTTNGVGIGTDTLNLIGNGGTQTTLNIHRASGQSYLSLSSDLTTDNSILGVLNFGTSGASTNKGAGSIQMELEGSGTTNASANMRFYTRNGATFGERMVIQYDGNVGIGTTSPAYKLDIGNFGSEAQTLRLTAASNYNTSIRLMEVDDNTGFSLKYDAVANRFGIFGHLSAAGTEHISITRNDGNVGIGTTNPLYKLEVQGTGYFSGAVTYGGGLTVTGNILPSADDTYTLGDDTHRWSDIFLGGETLHIGTIAGDEGTMSYITGNDVLTLNAGSATPAFAIASSGNIGIGTTSPGAKLHITGDFWQAGSSSNGVNLLSGSSGSAATFKKIGTAHAAVLWDGSSFNFGSISTETNISTFTAKPRVQIAGSLSDAGVLTSLSVINDRTSGQAVNDGVSIDFQGSNSASVRKNYSQIQSVFMTLTAGSEVGDLLFKTMRSGTSTEAVRITGTGNVGIGTTSPGSSLQVNGNAVIGYAAGTATTVNGLAISGNVGIGTTSPNQKFEVNGRIRMATWTADGDTAVYYNSATGDIGVQASDVRLKKNIAAIPNALAIIESINGVTFNWKSGSMSDEKQVGVIAQDVASAMPELTFPVTGPDGKDYLGVRYEKLAPVIIEAVKEQQTQIADVNLKTSQNVETVGQLQKSVDENLTVISSNFSAIDTKLALHDSELASSSAEEAGQNAKIADIDSRLTSLDTQTSVITAQVSALNGNMSLNEAEKADLVSRLAAAENKLEDQENDLADFEKETKDKLSLMFDMLSSNQTTENMLTDQLQDLKNEVATLTVLAGGDIPANVVTQDAGNVTLAGIFEAKSVVAGAFSVKNDLEKKTMGDGTILKGGSEKKLDNVEDKMAVTEKSKIFVSFETDPGTRYWVEKTEKIIDPETKEITGFAVKLSEPAAANAKFSWWIVEEK